MSALQQMGVRWGKKITPLCSSKCHVLDKKGKAVSTFLKIAFKYMDVVRFPHHHDGLGRGSSEAERKVISQLLEKERCRDGRGDQRSKVPLSTAFCFTPSR